MTTALTHCDLEPVHLPSAVQEFGALLVIDLKNLHPVQVSANCETFLTYTAAQLVHQSVRSTLGERVETALQKKQSRCVGETWSANIWYQENVAILEIEKAASVNLKIESEPDSAGKNLA